MAHEEYATVDDLILILLKAQKRGYGNYVVTCNREYYLAKKGDQLKPVKGRLEVDIGGYP